MCVIFINTSKLSKFVWEKLLVDWFLSVVLHVIEHCRRGKFQPPVVGGPLGCKGASTWVSSLVSLLVAAYCTLDSVALGGLALHVPWGISEPPKGISHVLHDQQCESDHHKQNLPNMVTWFLQDAETSQSVMFSMDLLNTKIDSHWMFLF